jgi:hypothetical protein
MLMSSEIEPVLAARLQTSSNTEALRAAFGRADLAASGPAPPYRFQGMRLAT